MVNRPEPSEIDYARLAAYIDGEGSVGIQRNKKSWFAQLTIVNTDPRIVLWLYETFGGFIGKRGWNNRRNPKWRKTLVWYLTCEKLHSALLKCRPYLLAKGEQVDIVVAFRATVKRVGVKGHSAEVVQSRNDMMGRLKVLRHREYSKEEFDEIADNSKSPREKAG